MSDEGTTATTGRVADADGGSTLVVGADGHEAACRTLAGSEDAGTQRIRVTGRGPTTGAVDATDLYDAGVYDDLDLAAAGTAVTDVLDTVEAAAAEAVERFVVCVDGLPEPTDSEDRERLLRFLHAVTRRVANAGGECHVHVPAERDDAFATTVAPLFDDVVDARDAASPST
ncbi:DUF7504 family protein [Halobacterium litoreum]|uniref:Short chain dehydrogenase n=1 Tax=Halobacterium litoreum TaxID=2039234 RepID=A0ABD5NI32_9EURY|nr:hypothetical protein [Halobacterium litoreum]UHH12254.1 hypothetical protein LT972_08800 [Halobacterium litoreum]